jgi:hypothetical protein
MESPPEYPVEEWAQVTFVDRTPTLLLTTILSHPTQLPTGDELLHLIPDSVAPDSGWAEIHLRNVLDAGIVTAIDRTTGRVLGGDSDGLDFDGDSETVYGLTEAGYQYVHDLTMDREIPTFRAAYNQMRKPPHIRQHEQLDRPAYPPKREQYRHRPDVYRSELKPAIDAVTSGLDIRG